MAMEPLLLPCLSILVLSNINITFHAQRAMFSTPPLGAV